MKRIKIVQLILGIVLIILGFYMIIDCVNIPSKYVEGIILGEGSVLMLWGMRELLGGMV